MSNIMTEETVERQNIPVNEIEVSSESAQAQQSETAGFVDGDLITNGKDEICIYHEKGFADYIEVRLQAKFREGALKYLYFDTCTKDDDGFRKLTELEKSFFVDSLRRVKQITDSIL